MGGDRAISGGIAVLLISGEGYVSFSVSHGCEPLGSEREVTRAEGGWLQAIDGAPAWTVFKEYLDGDPQDLNAEGVVHLCIGEQLEPEAAAVYAPLIIRTPTKLDPQSGALFFPGGGLSQGTTVHLTRRDQDRIRTGAATCAKAILNGGGRQPAFVLQVDCAGRGRIMFGTGVSAAIVAPLRALIGPETPWVGFHSYGEIAPILGVSRYHNYSVVLCALFDGVP